MLPRAMAQKVHGAQFVISRSSSRHRGLETSLVPPRNRFPDSRFLILPSSLFVRNGPELRNGKVRTLVTSNFCLSQISISWLTVSQDDSGKAMMPVAVLRQLSHRQLFIGAKGALIPFWSQSQIVAGQGG